MAIVIAVILGGAFGALIGQGTGAVAGAAIGWLVIRSIRQQGQIDTLRQALAAVKAAPSAIDSPVTAGDVAGTPIDVPLDALEPSDIDLDLDDAPTPASVKAAAPTGADRFVETHPGGAPVMPPVDAPAPRPVRTPSPAWDALRGWLFGGNTIVKAGVGILFVGLAFLAKYASEHVARAGRVAPRRDRRRGACVLLGFGWRLRLSRPGYAQVLQGGAIAVLYLTLFAAFRFYGVLGGGAGVRADGRWSPRSPPRSPCCRTRARSPSSARSAASRRR